MAVLVLGGGARAARVMIPGRVSSSMSSGEQKTVMMCDDDQIRGLFYFDFFLE